MSSDELPATEPLYNVLGIQPTDPKADKTVVEITCHPSMVERFRQAIGSEWVWPGDIAPYPVRITPSVSLEPMHFLTKYASGRVTVGTLIEEPYHPNRRARRAAAARARKARRA